jgi:DNA-binding transcriptional LysR family regulator
MPNTPARNPDSAPTAIRSKASSMSSLGSRGAIMSLNVFEHPAFRTGNPARLHGPPARLSRFKAGRKIRISGRLWMNGLEAAVAKEGAGIVRGPPWQAEADLAAGRPVHLLVDGEAAPTPLHLMFQPPRLPSPRIRNLRPLRRQRWRSLDPSSLQSST